MKEALALIATILLGMFAASQSVGAFTITKSPKNTRLSPVYSHIDGLTEKKDMDSLKDVSQKISQKMDQYNAGDFVFIRLAEIRNYINGSVITVAHGHSTEIPTSPQKLIVESSGTTQPATSILLALSELFGN